MHNLYGQEWRETKLLKINCSESSCGSLQETDIFMSIMYLIYVWFVLCRGLMGMKTSVVDNWDFIFIEHAGELLIFDKW